MTFAANEFPVLVILSCLVLFPQCFNPSVDGPDVISIQSAEKRFRKVLASKLATYSDPLFAILPIERRPSDFIYGCIRNSYYLTSAVDYCEKALTLNNGKTAEEIFKHHIFILTFVCELKRISFFGPEKPLQGEINWCGATGQEMQDL
jgi:hypothetical protein